MKPEIKFRVWAHRGNRYLHSHKNTGHCFGIGAITDEDIEEFGGHGVDSFLDDDNFIVERYTGLKDSKGVEIWEGDIVNGLFQNTDIHHWHPLVAPVVWVVDKAGFNIGSANWDIPSLEVIGNIHKQII